MIQTPFGNGWPPYGYALNGDLLAAPYPEGCPDCGAPDRTPCHGWCPNRHEPPGDDDG